MKNNEGKNLMGEGEECYRRYLSGDESGFDELVRLYRRDLTAYAASILKDGTLAEDAAIDAFAELVANRGRYNFSIPIKSYLFMVCRSRALDILRKNRRLVSLSAVKESPYEETGFEKITEGERNRDLALAVENLSERERSAIWLVYRDGMSYKEAAAAMKINEKKLDNIIQAAKKKLRETLGDDEDDR